MTRFMMTLENAVELVLYAFENGNTEIFLFKKPHLNYRRISRVHENIYKSNTEIKNIGIRHGEKIHETLYLKKRD